MGGRGSAGGKGALAAPAVGDEIRVADWFRSKIDRPAYAMTPWGGDNRWRKRFGQSV